jgi:ChaB protein
MLRSRRYHRDGNELPATLRRSCQEAQDTFTKAHDSAVQVYGEGDQADRAAFTALKQTFEKRGDHWIAKRDPGD